MSASSHCFGLVVLSYVFAAACGDDSAGGSDEPDPPGDSGAMPEFPCDVQAVLDDSCLRCHGEPRQNGAPVQFLTHEQVHEVRGSRPLYESMGSFVESDFMPPVNLDVEPPVEPLEASQKQILLDWVAERAPAGTESCE